MQWFLLYHRDPQLSVKPSESHVKEPEPCGLCHFLPSSRPFCTVTIFLTCCEAGQPPLLSLLLKPVHMLEWLNRGPCWLFNLMHTLWSSITPTRVITGVMGCRPALTHHPRDGVPSSLSLSCGIGLVDASPNSFLPVNSTPKKKKEKKKENSFS